MATDTPASETPAPAPREPRVPYYAAPPASGSPVPPAPKKRWLSPEARRAATIGTIIAGIIGTILSIPPLAYLLYLAIQVEDREAIGQALGSLILLPPLIGIFFATKGFLIGACCPWVMRQLRGQAK